jgi:hypothetical protein
MRYRLQKTTAFIGVTGAAILAAGTAFANPVITNLQLVNQRRISRFVIEATYRADARSAGGAFRNVTAIVSSTNPATTIVDNSLMFPDIADGATVTSTDTFTIRHDLSTPFQNNFLSFQVNATPVVANRPPVANAGPDQTAAVGATVTLNGSASSDPDGNPLTFSWTLTGRPAGSTAVLMNPASVSPAFIVDRAGNYTISLVVNDGSLSSAPDTVTVSTSNSAPVANAGSDQTAPTGTLVTLNGTASSDADGNPLTFSWTILTRPTGSTAALSNPASITPAFTLDRFGTYVVRLIVNDGQLNSAPDTVTINTVNSPPVANAGPDRTALVGGTVALDGSLSSDVDGQALTFSWSMLSAPSGSTSTISNPSAVAPSITITRPGSYVLQLIVNDGFTNSAPDTMTITTLNSPPVANAGPDQTVTVGSTVTLNGSSSSDVDGNPLTFAWSLTTRPAGSAAVISNPAAVMPTFAADVAGQYIAQLIVNDGTVNSAPDTVIVNTGNSPPIANAGPNQTVAAGSLVTLNGSASSDVDGNPLTFAWSFVSRPAGSTATLSNPTAVMPAFTADALGDFVVQLIVNDGTVNSAPDTVTITTANTAPTANAGPDQTVAAGSVVTLNGGASSDAEGAPLTFSWSLITRPAGSTAVLSGANSVTPTFTADRSGTYVAQLIVNDGSLSSAPDTVTIDTSNVPPVANAGPDQVVPAGSVVVLDGSASSDADGQPLTYAWSFTSRPSGSTAALSNANSISPAFVADRSGTYVVQLIVSDLTTSSVPDTVTITTQNAAPTADAGPDSSVDVGEAVLLDGAGSSDPDGNPLTYSWSITSAPSGSTATLTNPASATPSLTPDVAGTYTIRLIVNDGSLSSAPDTVTVTASDPGGGTLTNGALHNGSIDVAGEVDTWTFTANAGDRIGVHIGQITDNNDFRPWIRLEAPGGAILGSNSATDAAAISDVVAPTTGTYTVLVASFDSGLDGTGSYRLTMTHTPGPITVSPGDEGGPLVNGAIHTGTITTGDLDVWTFAANAGERIAVHVGEITDNDDFRPWIRVWAPNGATLGSTSGVGAAAFDNLVAPVTGTYLVLVATFDSGVDGTGTYQLTMTHTPGPITVSPSDEGGPLVNGAMHTGTITQGDLDVWTFNANIGERIAVHIGEITETNDFRPWIRVWAPNGATLGSTSGVNAAALDDLIAPVTGTYLVLVATFDSGVDGSGTYRLNMTHTPGPIVVSGGDEGGALTNGGMHTGAITQGDLDIWTFTANAGERIAVHIGEITETNDFRPWIRVWAPNGATLGSTSGVNAAALDNLVAPVTGAYLVLVATFDSGVDGTGTYRLNMTRTPGPITVSSGDHGGPLTNGGMHTGTLDQGDLDVWTFNANVGERIAVHIGEIIDNNDFRPWIRVWAPNGATLGSASGLSAAALDGLIAPVTGTYLVLVATFDSGVDGSGSYRLTMTHTPGPIVVSGGDEGGPLSNGALHTGAITQGDLDIWTFTASAGDRIAVHIGEITETSDFRPWIRVWAPNGATLGSSSGLTAAALDNLVAPVSGTYLVLIATFDSGVDGTGTYRLTMTHTPGPVAITPGDQGGALINGAVHNGDILQGDLDVWTITVPAGMRISVQINETSETNDFRPWVRLWAPNGATLGSASGLTSAQILPVVAPASGTYLVLVSTFDSGVDGAGAYSLTVTVTP